ncbi:MAG: ABC-type transport auxiliary lipoprotein family protein, partial [Rhodospirillaceae bacterium]
LQRLTIDVLRNANVFEAVTSPALRLDRDYELLGNLLRFEHVPESSSVIVEIEITLRRVRGNEPLILKTYTAEASVSGRSIDAAVAGFSNALNGIFADLAADIAAAMEGRATA